MIAVLQLLLATIGGGFLALLGRRVARERPPATREAAGLGAAACFFDTLGIGSFAPTTAYLKLRRLVPDKEIPAVLNIGYALPTVVQAAVFIHLIEVDPRLLAACIVAAVAGAVAGTLVVPKLPVRTIQAAMGAALLIGALIFALDNLQLLPAGGTARGLSGSSFWMAVICHFILGALMTVGIGLYAPSLILLSLMGLDPRSVFPIMMGACAFLMPVAGLGFARRGSQASLGAAISLTLGGIPMVLVAAFLVKSLPLHALRWGVVAVVAYAALVMLRSAWTAEPGEASMAPAR